MWMAYLVSLSNLQIRAAPGIRNAVTLTPVLLHTGEARAGLLHIVDSRAMSC